MSTSFGVDDSHSFHKDSQPEVVPISSHFPEQIVINIICFWFSIAVEVANVLKLWSATSNSITLPGAFARAENIDPMMPHSTRPTMICILTITWIKSPSLETCSHHLWKGEGPMLHHVCWVLKWPLSRRLMNGWQILIVLMFCWFAVIQEVENWPSPLAWHPG